MTSETDGPGIYTFNVLATDTATPPLATSTPVTVIVNEINQAPTITPITDRDNTEGETVFILPAGYDPDQPTNTLTWTATGLPFGLNIDPTSGEISGQIAKGASAASPYTVVVSLTDNGSSLLHAG